MCNLQQALVVVAAHGGFPTLGFKAASTLTGTPRSSMRYAKKAWEHGMVGAVLLGTISDQRVVGILASLPRVASSTVARIETKLRRHLTRERAAQIAANFKMERRESHLRRMIKAWDRSAPAGVASEWRVENV